ncbi:hypothetical protein RND81_05G246500 [Saponaria officinalis]|uniref:Uncharacterized protein n=1 Tax=Saponaria officinalis TaxID=3572 RepID=A0AAW1L0Y4_SAPOF
MMLVESIPRWMCQETFEKFAAISLLSGHDFSCLSGVEAPMLQILLLKGDLSSTTLKSDFFRGMTNLKVLSLSNIDFSQGLPTSIGQLKRLRTFHLHYCYLKDIKLIGKLRKLLVLSLRGSTLEKLPDEIGELCNLRLLDMRGCKGKINIGGNILSRLSHLEGLYMSISFNDWASMKTKADDGEADNKARVSEFNKLCHLNVLEIEVPEPELLPILYDAQLMYQLDDFSIRVGNFRHWYLDEVQSFCRVLKLSRIIDASQNKFLKTFLKKTTCLQVEACRSLAENLVPQLDEEGFKDLKYLQVNECDDVKFIIRPENQNESSAFVNLKTLKLVSMKKLEMICDLKAPARAFSNLRNLFLYGLHKLTYGLPLTVVPMNLVDVCISECPNLKFIISESEPEADIIEFQSLNSMWLGGVASLSSVLGEAEINAIDDGEQAAQPFFHKNCLFPSLETLTLWGNDTIAKIWSKACHVSGFQNLKRMRIWGCTELQSLGSPSIFAALLRLEFLSIADCDKLQQVITKETVRHEVREHVIVFPYLQILRMDGLSTLERFYGGSCKLEFPILRSLCLQSIGNLTNFVGSDNSTAFFCDKSLFPSLEKLTLRDGGTIVTLWSEACHVSCFQNLKQINISRCAELQSLGSPSVFATLVQLEQLSISKCGKLQEVISKETEGHGVGEHIIVFTRLKRLSMDNLSNLQTFYGGSCKLEFPMLNSLSLSFTDSLANFVGSENSTTLFSNKIEFPRLKNLEVHRVSNEVVSFWNCSASDGHTQAIPNLLESLEISGCENMKAIIMDKVVGDIEGQVHVFPRLKSLIFKSLPSFTCFAYKPSAALCFPSLESVELQSCTKLQSYCSGSFQAPKLKTVVLKDCNNMQSFLSENMNNIQELPSIERVEIRECPMLLSFSRGPLTAPKLRYVYLEECPKIKLFSPGDPKNDDILELPSLKEVSIKMCSGMLSFSQGQIKAPKLSELKVDDDNYSERPNEELQHKLQNLHKCTSREIEEDMKDEGNEERRELEEQKE